MFSPFRPMLLFLLASLRGVSSSDYRTEKTCVTEIANGCMTFTLGPGTGCSWMCDYCAKNLGTNNYYFTDGVCVYTHGGCIGEPVAGKEYTCCSA